MDMPIVENTVPAREILRDRRGVAPLHPSTHTPILKAATTVEASPR